MKRTLQILSAAMVFALLSCSSQTDKKTKIENAGSPVTKSGIISVVDTLINNKPVHLTKADFLKVVMNYEKNPDVWTYLGDKPCLIDFYADWCRPCKITAHILDELAAQYAGRIIIYKINVDEEQELAGLFGIESIPSFLFCPLKGKPTISSGIANSPEETKAMFVKEIEELLLNNLKASEK
jgi:thioredoxin